jgi:molybdopterin converting factor small subunit
MLLEVKCYATLAKFQPQENEFHLGPRPMLRDLTGFLQIPEDEIKITFANGISVGLDHELHEGDRIGIFPAVGGG